MFGMKRRAKERAAAELDGIKKKVRTYMVDELLQTVAWLKRIHNLDGKLENLSTKIENIQKGIDAVFVDDLNPYGPDLEGMNVVTAASAMIANGKLSVFILSDTFDRAEVRGDFCHLIGLTRDGLVVREQKTS